MDTVAAALIRNKNRLSELLLQKHNKTGLWTFPIGKVEDGESPQDALKRELKEELGIEVEELEEIMVRDLLCPLDPPITVKTYLFEVKKYRGTIENMEPHKHSELAFMGGMTIERLPLTEATKMFLFNEE